MFQYFTEAKLEAVAREHPGDIVVKVDSSLDTMRKLIDHVEGAVKAPYTNDNWEGLRETLFDLSWLPDGQGAWLLNYGFPSLEEKDLDIYMSILIEADKVWPTYLDDFEPDKLHICFLDSMREEVEFWRRNRCRKPQFKPEDGIVDIAERNDMSVIGIKKKCLWLFDKIDGIAGISPKRRSLIPFFITDSPLSDFRELHSRTIYPLMKVLGRRRSLDYIAALVKREESRVSWVDIFLYSFDGEKAVYFVKLVCIGKREGFVGFHACVDADLNGNTILH